MTYRHGDCPCWQNWIERGEHKLPDRSAYCCECRKLGYVTGGSHGMGVFFYRDHKGQDLWRWLCRAGCRAAWEGKYVRFMREKHSQDFWRWVEKDEAEAA